MLSPQISIAVGTRYYQTGTATTPVEQYKYNITIVSYSVATSSKRKSYLISLADTKIL